jgi:6-phosphogluconolactonase
MSSPAPLLVLVTMFAAEPAGGIRAFHLDPQAGTLVPAATTRGCPNGFFLTLSPDGKTVYSLSAGRFGAAETEQVIAWRLVDGTGRLEPLGRQVAGGAAACFVAVDPAGESLLVAHYSGGTVAAIPLEPDGRLAGKPLAVRHGHEKPGPVADRQAAAHPHAIIPAPRAPGGPQLVLTADLGCDAIFAHRLEAGRLVPHEPDRFPTRPGAGPRHLAFHPSGRWLYAVNELDNTVAVYGFAAASGRLVERQVISTLPPSFRGTTKTADVKLSPDGRFLYATNRGHDSIAGYAIGEDGELSLVEIVSSRGAGPQNLAITPDGGLLLVANMEGDSLALFRIAAASGRLTAVGDPVAVTKPSAIVLVP